MNLDTELFLNLTVYDLLFVTIFIVGIVLISKILTLIIKRSLSGKVEKSNLDIIGKIINITLVIIGIVTISPVFGIHASGILVAGGVVGIIIGFASQSIVANLISGIFMIIERPLKIGDQISVDGISGYIMDIRVLSTNIRTYEGLLVRILKWSREN